MQNVNTKPEKDKGVISYLNCSCEEITMEKFYKKLMKAIDTSSGLVEVIETRLVDCRLLTQEEAGFLYVNLAAQKQILELLTELYPN